MVAALLPLPPDPQSEKARAMRDSINDEFMVALPESFRRQLAQAEELRFQSARWWRTLNRLMAVIGLLLLGAIAALVVIGVREGWGQ